MRKKGPPTKSMLTAAQMPPLSHYPNRTEAFDITKSQALQWLLSRPTILSAIFNHFVDRGAIVFDPNTKLWQGRDFQE